MERWSALDGTMRYMAIARLLDHWDDVTTWYCGPAGNCRNHNYYWYESAVADRLWLIPWDLDLTLGNNPHRARGYPEWDDLAASCEPMARSGGRSVLAPTCDPVLHAMAASARDRYVAASEELLAGPFAEGALEARIEALEALLADAIAADPLGPGEAAWRAGVAELRSRLIDHRAFIRARLQ